MFIYYQNERSFSPVYAVIELFDQKDYLSVPGLSHGSSARFHNIKFTPKMKEISKFIHFHKAAGYLEAIDPLELVSKLRVSRLKQIRKVQRIPSHVHSYIVDWLTENPNSMWLNWRSESYLGKRFEVSAESLPPGRLLSYGTGDRQALVLNEKVARERQKKGLIHPNRVNTPFEPVSIDFDSINVEGIFSGDSAWKKLGLASVREIARSTLSNLNAPTAPYYQREMMDHILERMKDQSYKLGKDMIVSEKYSTIMKSVIPLRNKRSLILAELAPKGVSIDNFINEQPNEFIVVLRALL